MGQKIMDLFHTVAIVTVPEHVNFNFVDAADDIQNKPKSTNISFPTTLDHLNFTELTAGSTLGFVNLNKIEIPLLVTDEHEHNATSRYLSLESG